MNYWNLPWIAWSPNSTRANAGVKIDRESARIKASRTRKLQAYAGAIDQPRSNEWNPSNGPEQASASGAIPARDSTKSNQPPLHELQASTLAEHVEEPPHLRVLPQISTHDIHRGEQVLPSDTCPRQLFLLLERRGDGPGRVMGRRPRR